MLASGCQPSFGLSLMPVRAIISVSIAAAAVAVLSAQAPPARQEVPTFREGVQLVEVDVIITDRHGNPVRDLTKDDFEILEDNRAQSVRTFSLVDLPVPPRAPEVTSGGIGVVPDTATNASPEGRTYVLLLDAESTLPAPNKGQELNLRTQQLARQFLDEAVRPGDQVAVVHAQGSATDAQGFTTNRVLIDRSIERFGRGLNSSLAGLEVTPQERVTRTLATYHSIGDLAERLGLVGGRRKAIVWIGGQIDAQPERKMKGQGLNPIAAAAGVLRDALHDALQAAARNNVAVYPVDPVGLELATGEDELVRVASLRLVAEETGGIATVNSNNFTDAYAAIVRDASTYYLLGYSPEREPRQDGAFHPITVRVKRPDVTVRARPGYYTAKAAPSSKPLPKPPDGVSLSARDALRRPLATRGLGLDVTTTTFKGKGNDASVVVTAHVRGQTVDFDAGKRLAISYQVFDVDGNVATGFYKVFGFNLKPETVGRASETGLQFVERITLKPGRYELRLVAEQPEGPIGSVITHIDATKFDRTLAMSGVALAAHRTSEVLLVNDRQLRSALSADPTALRSFRAADGLSAYTEIYTELSSNIPAAQVSRVKAATVTGAITTAAGAFVGRGQGDRVTVDADRTALREGFRIDFDLSRVVPGSYVLTLEARSSETGGRVARRQIPFAVE